ncbi:MAG: TRAP transporter substrate-binding protein, partial [Candidatus Rokubacteria bacterium]|nr:TRAP transporter substrate-binding protein [Candidatus Rokubacteria bacterium]
MRRLALVSLVLLVVFMMVPGPGAAQPTLGPGPKLTLTVSSHPIPVHPQYAKLDLTYYSELIPKRSNGRISVKSSTWSELGMTGYEIVRMTRQGQLDIGNSPLTYIAQDVPVLDVADLAGLNPTVELARKVLDALKPAVNKELEKFNVKLIGSNPYPAQILFCRHPIRELADLKGRKVRTFGPTLNDLMKAVGATPVSLAYAETYTALERGVVDCGITGSGSGNAAKWHEVTTHQYTLPLTCAVSGYYPNLAWLNKQSPDVRKFIEDTWREIEDKQWQFGGVELTQDGIDCNSGRPTCKVGTRAARPMVEVKPTEADRALM